MGGGWTLRKPDKRDSAREEIKVSSFPQHYLAVDVKYLIYFCLITKGLFIYPNMSGNYNVKTSRSPSITQSNLGFLNVPKVTLFSGFLFFFLNSDPG